jgi:hypothetical protein
MSGPAGGEISVDGGNTWEKTAGYGANSSHGGLGCHDLCALDGNSAWLLLFMYNLFYLPNIYYCWSLSGTSSAGSSWDHAEAFGYHPGVLEYYKGVSSLEIADDSTLWVSLCSIPPVVTRSTDGGTTWITNELNGLYIYDIHAFDADSAWAIGNATTSQPGTGASVILKTADGGVTWETQYGESGLGLSSISAVDPSTAWAVGELDLPYAAADKCVILKTTDGGATWTTQYESTGGYLSCVCAVDADTAWGGGKDASGAPLILKTGNGGEPIPLSVASITPERGTQHTLFLDITDLAGSNFKPGATVRLEKDERVINAFNVSLVSSREMTCSFGLFGAEPGAYDVVVTNPDGDEARLPAGFTVEPLCGAGSGTALLMLGLTLGLISLAGTARMGRRKRRKTAG